MRTLALLSCCVLIAFASPALSQTISSIQPKTIKPGETTRLTLRGTDLSDALRAITTSQPIQVVVQSVVPTEAILQLSVPAEHPLGPVGLMIADGNGPVSKSALLVDDLPLVVDNGSNHTPDTAQAIEQLSSVEGTCDASLSDFYRLRVEAGQRVAFEVHSQQILSSMDPVVRLLTADGHHLRLADDNGIGPDSRFSHRFESAGETLIEVFDSRHGAAGSPYQLRVGDFPVLSGMLPLVAQAEHLLTPEFLGGDAQTIVTRDVTPHNAARGGSYATAQFPDGHSSTWWPIAVSDSPQIVERQATEPLVAPVGVSGFLSTPHEVDKFAVSGTKGQAVRVRARTRSLGSPTLLEMQLCNAAGEVVARTQVSDADEWELATTYLDDATYELRVTDLLHRGGPDFTYWFELQNSGAIELALKPDAAIQDQFTLESKHGATAIDLLITRHGYDGPIRLELSEPIAGLQILNPTIPPGASEARVYLASDATWDPRQLAAIHLVARPNDGNEQNIKSLNAIVSGRPLQRIKAPHVLNPPLWSESGILLAGASPTDAPFALEPSAPVQFARPVANHAAVLQLKRTNEAFKAGVALLNHGLPAGWSVTAAADADTYTANFASPGDAASRDLTHMQIPVFAEFNGRGRIEMIDLPIEWFDPVQVSLEPLAAWVRGGKARVRVTLKRQGGDPQPVTLSLSASSSGIAGLKPTTLESTTLAAEQTVADFEIQLAPEAPSAAMLSLDVKSAFKGQEFMITSTPLTMDVVDGPEELSVFPTEIALVDPRSHQRVIVSGDAESQQPVRDWTRLASFSVANPAIAEVVDGVVRPKADGQTELLVEVGLQTRSIPIHVTGSAQPRPIDFESETLVALSKQGCNSGACHGSPSGKGGFRLSLRAFDHQLDELTLIREDYGRRTNPLDAENSLLLLKPLMKLSHGGGKQLRQDDVAYQILRDWIAEGASMDPPDTPRIERLEVVPHQKRVLQLRDGGQQLAITAHFADGSSRDVTELAAYETSDTGVATVDEHGYVTPHRRGEIAILVRFLEHIEALPLMFVEHSPDFKWAVPEPNNYIDELVNRKLQQFEYLPAETCSDAEFLRRVSLDVTGIMPNVEQTRAFLSDSRPDKRSRLVDGLLERDEYPKFWALKWGDLLRMTSKLVGDEGVYKYHRWVEQALRQNMPYDQFARELLTASGSTLANPPANFYRTASDMNDSVETVSQVFLGARLQCAKCHNHPFERWTQDNYYGLGAFFNRVERRKTSRAGEMFVYTKSSGDVTQPRTGQVMAPWLPQVGSIENDESPDRRQLFADWLVSPDNPYFARIEANRIWSQLFARGIVDPIDDFRDSNPPSNTPLLDALAADFVESGYDRKHLLRVILNSRTYQASYQTNEHNREDLLYSSHQEPRLLSAEQLLDAINMTLAIPQNFGSLPPGTRATQLPAPDLAKVDFLVTFGQPERSTVCACERGDDSNLGMALELFNGPMMHEKLRHAENRFRKLLAEGRELPDIIEELYLAAVCRPPSEIELQAAMDHCAKHEDKAAALEDVCWALFNTDEFLFQH